MSNRVAVFNRGRIEQVGTPREIYTRPATPFVAGFVGTSNLLDDAMSQRLLGVGGVHIVRPERIRVSADEPMVGDSVVHSPGTVADVLYLGPESRVRVQLDDGPTLLASVPSDGLAGVATGGRAHVAWPRDAAFLVANGDPP